MQPNLKFLCGADPLCEARKRGQALFVAAGSENPTEALASLQAVLDAMALVR